MWETKQFQIWINLIFTRIQCVKLCLYVTALFRIENVHTLLTPDEREKIFGEPFSQSGEYSEMFFWDQLRFLFVLYPIFEQGGVAIYHSDL